MYEKELKEISKLRSAQCGASDRRSKTYKDAESKIKEISKSIYRDYAQRMFESWGVFDQFGVDSFGKNGNQYIFLKGEEEFYFEISLWVLNSYNGGYEPPSGRFVNHFGSFNKRVLENLSKEAVKAYVDKTISDRNKDRNSQHIRQNLLKKFAEALKDKIDTESYAHILKDWATDATWRYDDSFNHSLKNPYIRLEGSQDTDTTLRISGDIRCNLPLDRAIEMYKDLRALADKYCF